MKKITNAKIKLIRNSIANLDLEVSNYKVSLNASDQDNNNIVYMLDEFKSSEIQISFSNGVENSVVFIGSDQKCSGVKIKIEYSQSIVYLGSNCSLKKLSLRGGDIYIGDHVSSHEGRWQSGTHAREILRDAPCLEAMIVVGDDCMFSRDITIRTSDAHPVFDFNSKEIVNSTEESVVIEPHVWVCENVSIMKGVKVGACSILALGGVITRNIPRNSSAGGVPAKPRPLNGRIWARNTSKSALQRSEFYYKKYINI